MLTLAEKLPRPRGTGECDHGEGEVVAGYLAKIDAVAGAVTVVPQIDGTTEPVAFVIGRRYAHAPAPPRVDLTLELQAQILAHRPVIPTVAEIVAAAIGFLAILRHEDTGHANFFSFGKRKKTKRQAQWVMESD